MLEALVERYRKPITASLSGLILLGSGIAFGVGLSQVESPPPSFQAVGVQESSGGPVEVSPSQEENFSINLNTASLSDLERLPGIGPVKAQSIINYRESVGKFHSKEDIVNVSGIGPSTYQKMKDLIVVK